uniref:Sulfatase domain-containing protein n=3 Tax=Macrostomum lignano TaxID=282301 RepID=A0A1I8GVD2_9PLAT
MVRIMRRIMYYARLGRSHYRLMWTLIICVPIVYVFLELLRQPNLIKKRFHPLQIKQDVVLSGAKEDTESLCILPPLQQQLISARPLYTLNCTAAEPNWVTSEGGTFRITDATRSAYPDVKCAMVPVLRDDDFSVYYGEAVDDISTNRQLINDFFVANCASEQRSKQYQLLHAGIAPKLSKEAPYIKQNQKPLSIILFGLDSVSREAWKRYLPKSYGYFINDIGGVVFEKFNILGDGTTPNLLPMLTGHLESELYESRRGFNNSKPVDDYPWIWRDLAAKNYTTQFGEDGSKYGTFQYRLLGFKKQPTDHYMRPFYLKLDELYPHRKYGCLGSKPLHQVKIDWQKDFLDVYRNRKKFTFVFHSELSHEDNYYLSPMDADLLAYLRYLKESKHLDDSILILMSDHGHRYAKTRSTLQGKYEERLPFLGIALPKRLKDAHPIETKQLIKNQNRLITPLDLHATMRHAAEFFTPQPPPQHQENTKTTSKREAGVSLFTPISEKRNCAQIGIEAHWCACLAWQSLSPLGTNVKTIGYYVVAQFNAQTEKHRDQCAELTFSKLLAVDGYAPSTKILSFKASADADGRNPDFSDTMSAGYRLYRLTIETLPNHGHYEVTVQEDIASHRLSMDINSVSRVNAYRQQAACLGDKLPHLRALCYCLHQKSEEQKAVKSGSGASIK